MRRCLAALVVLLLATWVSPGESRHAQPIAVGQAPVAQESGTWPARARELLRTAIGFRTVAGQGQVPAFANSLAERFRAGGFPAGDVRVLTLGETASLVVRYRGNGTGGRPVLFLAHMDVVPALAEDWKRDPFTLAEENGYFLGRGTADIKGDLVLLVTTFLRLKREGFVPRRDLILAFTGDEETGMMTARDLAEKHRDLVDAEFALNGDGGGGQLDDDTGAPQVYYVQGAEKSYASFAWTVRSPGGHSSQPRPDNAIYRLARALTALEAYRFPVMWNEWTIGSLKATAATTSGKLAQAMAAFAANPREGAAADVLFASPPYVGKTRTTCVATMLAGGHAENALPQSAGATVNCRIFPGTSVEEVKATLEKVAGNRVEVRTLGSPHASPPSPMRADVMAAITRAVHAIHPGVPLVPDMAAYATDAAVFRGAGIPTYGASSVFLKPSEDFSHGLNERLPVAGFYAGLDYWYVLVKEIG